MVMSGPAAMTPPGRIMRVTARGIAYVPLLPGLSPDAREEYRRGCCSRPRQLAFRAQGDYVAGISEFLFGSGTGEVQANGGILSLGRYMTATACRFPAGRIEAGPDDPPGSIAQDRGTRYFSLD